MNGAYFEFPQMMVASFTLACSACMAWQLLRWIKPSSHQIHRLVWFAVLLNSVFLVRFSVEIPILNPDSPLAVSLLDQHHSKPLLRHANAVSPATELDFTETTAAVTNIEPSLAANPEPTDALTTADKTFLTPSSADKSSMPAISLIKLLQLLWVVGFIATLCLFALHYLVVLRQLSRAHPARESWTKQLRQLLSSAGITRDVPLLQHASLGPALVLTPRGYRIVIPSSFWSKLNDGQRTAILNHEVAHLQRGDIWKSMCVTLLASTHWFNPFGWLAVRKFNEAAEWACDQAVGFRDSLVRADFARALMCLSAADNRWLLGASSFGSSGMSSRIRRLFASPGEDTFWGRLTVCMLVSLIVAVGWVNVRFVTAASALPPTRLLTFQDEQQNDKRVNELQKQLADSEHELSTTLATALTTEAGRIALMNRINGIEEDMRNEAAKLAIPEFFATQIDSQFSERLDREINEAREDIAKLKKGLAELRSKLGGTSEAEQLLIRFLETENAAQVFYFSQLRQGMRPSVERVMQESLGRVLTDDGTGRLVVRESAKPRLEKQLSRISEIEEQLDFVRQELIEWSKEIAPKDDLHKKIKEGLRQPSGHVYMFAGLIREGGNPRQMTERYFEFLEDLFVDSSEGLIIPDERIEDVNESIAESDRLKAQGKLLRKPIGKIVDLIDGESSQAARLAKQFLQSDLGIAYVATQTNINIANPDDFLADVTERVLEENEQGKLVVREENLEQVTEFAREMLSNRRRLRRRGRFLEPQLKTLEDPSLKKLCESIEGRMLMIENIREYASTKRFDGWPNWIEDHLDQTPDGYVVRDEAREAIGDLLTEVEEINKELAKDDF